MWVIFLILMHKGIITHCFLTRVHGDERKEGRYPDVCIYVQWWVRVKIPERIK